MPEGVPVEIVNQVLWRIPNVLCLIGAAAGEEWNGMTASLGHPGGHGTGAGGGGGGPLLTDPSAHRRRGGASA